MLRMTSRYPTSVCVGFMSHPALPVTCFTPLCKSQLYWALFFTQIYICLQGQGVVPPLQSSTGYNTCN